MRKIWLLTFLLLIAGQSAFAQKLKKKDEKAIRECFDSYKSALLARDGQAAASLLDAHTRTYYSDILEQVRYADSLEILALPPMDKITVLAARVRMTTEELQGFDDDGFLVRAVELGMVSDEKTQLIKIGTLSGDKKKAEAPVISQGREMPWNYEFYKEDGDWKLNLVATFPEINELLAGLALGSNISQHEFIYNMLVNTYGTDALKGKWQPPMEK